MSVESADRTVRKSVKSRDASGPYGQDRPREPRPCASPPGRDLCSLDGCHRNDPNQPPAKALQSRAERVGVGRAIDERVQAPDFRRRSPPPTRSRNFPLAKQARPRLRHRAPPERGVRVPSDTWGNNPCVGFCSKGCADRQVLERASLYEATAEQIEELPPIT